MDWQGRRGEAGGSGGGEGRRGEAGGGGGRRRRGEAVRCDIILFVCFHLAVLAVKKTVTYQRPRDYPADSDYYLLAYIN